MSLTLTNPNEADNISPIYSFKKMKGQRSKLLITANIAHCGPKSYPPLQSQ